MWQSFHDAWWRLATSSRPHTFGQALGSGALRAGAAAYRCAVAARSLGYDRGWLPAARLPCRVISVGNLTVGGTGKTACVEWLARRLLAQSRRVAVVTHGYGGRAVRYALWLEGGRLLVEDLEGCASSPAEVPTPTPAVWRLADEPQLLALRLPGMPVLVGADRVASGRQACERFGADTVLLDDGFQHRRLARDCDIVLVSSHMPLGGWELLPRGPMREPLAAVRRAQVLIITKADESLATLGAMEERLQALAPAAVVAAAAHAPRALLDPRTGDEQPPRALEGCAVGLVSSIGDPDGFESTVRGLHAGIAWHRRFPDHHRYTAQDWAQVAAQAASGGASMIVTTEKDWIRLGAVAAAAPPAMPLRVLRVALTLLRGAEDLDARLAGVCAR